MIPLLETQEGYATSPGRIPSCLAKENPKAAVGNSKPSLANIPPVALYALGAAMADGAAKYGPFNFRETETDAAVFFNAMMRHLLDWWDGENYANDSAIHHLGHLMAGAAILLDAVHQGNLRDNRPAPSKTPRPSSGLSRHPEYWKEAIE